MLLKDRTKIFFPVQFLFSSIMGQNVIGRIVFGEKYLCEAKCPGASCPWGESSLGQVVHVYGAKCPWATFSLGEFSMG